MLREGFEDQRIVSRSISGVLGLTRLFWGHLNMRHGHPCVPVSSRLRTLNYFSMIVWEASTFDGINADPHRLKVMASMIKLL